PPGCASWKSLDRSHSWTGRFPPSSTRHSPGWTNHMHAGHIMRIECVFGQWHNLSQTAMAMVIDAYQSGEMRTLFSGHQPCLLKAFDNHERLVKFHKRYKGNRIVVDWNIR